MSLKKQYTIDRLTPPEWMSLKELRIRSVIDSPHVFGTTLEQMQSRSDQFWIDQVEHMACFTARSGSLESPHSSQVHHLGLVRGTRDPDHKKVVWLLGMWVDPSARGFGVGEDLTKAVIQWAQEVQASVLKLSVFTHNHHAIALYERTGFTLNTNEITHDRSISHPLGLKEVEYTYTLAR